MSTYDLAVVGGGPGGLAAAMYAALREWEPVDHAGPGTDGFVLRSAGQETTAAALVLALGLGRFTPRRLGLDGENRFLGRGLAYRLPPIEQISVGHAVVVGGGDTAFDTALSLQRVADVTLVHRSDEFRAYAHSQRRVSEAGLDVVTGGEIVELLGGDHLESCLLYTSDAADDLLCVDLGGR